MAIVQEIKSDLLGLIGIEEDSQADPKTLARILGDINASLQEIFTVYSDVWTTEQGGAYIHAPTQLTGVSVTQGSTAIVLGGGFQPWMDGCTVIVGSDPTQNQIRQTGASTYGLAFPYNGATDSNVGATVYCDSIALSDRDIKVMPRVLLRGKRELCPMRTDAQNRSHSYYYNSRYSRYASPSYNYVGNGYSVWNTERDLADPEEYKVDSLIRYDGKIINRIVLNPIPISTDTLTFNKKEAPALVEDFNDTRLSLMPIGYDRSVLIPWVREKFSSWIHFGAQDKIPLIQNDLQKAKAILDELNESQAVKPLFITNRGW